MDDTAFATISPTLRAGDFYDSAHGKIYAAMLKLSEQGQPIDLVSVGESAGEPSALVASLIDGVPDAGNAEWYAKTVKEKATLRRIIDVATKAARQGMDGDLSADELIASVTSSLYDIAGAGQGGTFAPIGEITNHNLDALDAATASGQGVGLHTGFRDLDAMLGGLQAGDLAILGARTSVGKTSLALNIAQNIACVQGKNVAFFSIEMSKDQLGLRVLCSLSDVDLRSIRDGRASAAQIQRLVEAQQQIARSRLYIDDSGIMSVPALRGRATKLRRDIQGLDLIVIDYMQLMQAHDGKESKVQEMTAISRGLKLLAKEIGAPVLALSQLSRQAAYREGPPQLSDLRESGSIEQDADIVIFLHRENQQYGIDPRVPVDLIVAKQRNGPTGRFQLVFDPSRMTFRDSYIPPPVEATEN